MWISVTKHKLLQKEYFSTKQNLKKIMWLTTKCDKHKYDEIINVTKHKMWRKTNCEEKPIL